ncbi:phosphoenolpyruvate carboxykinase [Candidatus Desantisbacteria bacterium CG1_02_38_46]|uniref:Phosphoenolpyruvate carboxykinase [GTP] n=3 Tax=unclassified Candidatus Desantisiibacteriota TaxID=3106372 RepID=A0A2H9PB05_9BACT|nr:MAG: phosphoenolpyruvate carboxykinase [Candidatus Desantisbacteria bacterium CG1_02_38_46]PIU51963.1 MAG: phosphoenolpyruvate carboxykinase (GTP) [Candidatus Desantisbacteria bacterium CG07_land_8_20_14_0_80_39_15]PIZ15843.1 MAG: phosphoenolpyruvate carboxykinase (GTP) [Candidatus Desantisbacteria bacterium CG_4_10_14_0_8_um_filter_39_17]
MATFLEKWVEEQARLTKPDKIYWCDGSDEEARKIVEIGLTRERIEDYNVFHKLSQKTFPSSYLHRSHPTDVARAEHLTYVCHSDKKTAGPNNNWMPPAQAKEKLTKLSDGCMRGRTMYVLPYMMGHPESPYAKACVQLTDVSYVAVSMRIMTRVGKGVIQKIKKTDNFVRGFHSVGDFHQDRRFIMHFPDENLVWSIGSGYGGNALLGKKCFSLRIASWLGLKENWLAEHMIIIGVEDPQGKITYIAAAMPSACGKTNLAMMEPALPGYKVWTVGDDIAWLNIGPDGRLWAINPENGFFGVASGTSMKTNPNMIRTLKAGKFYPTIFTNTALNTDTNDPWWEGLDGEIPSNLVDWRGREWNPSLGTKAAHPNSRFTVAISQCPTVSPEFNNPDGVPISAILLGGRRTNLIPLVYESFNWQHGVFTGGGIGSETTAAAIHKVGVLRRDPMAMLPFCGYNMGDYFRHWLNIGKRLAHPPKIFAVNWFRTDGEGNFLWPGFGENIRVLKWIIERINNKIGAKETPIGFVPNPKDLELDGINIPQENLEKLFEVNIEDWGEEIKDIQKFFEQFGKRMPEEIWKEFKNFKELK